MDLSTNSMARTLLRHATFFFCAWLIEAVEIVSGIQIWAWGLATQPLTVGVLVIFMEYGFDTIGKALGICSSLERYPL